MCVQTLGALIHGDGHTSLLSQACIANFLKHLHSHIAANQSISQSAGALLQRCLFSAVVWELRDDNPASKLLAAVYSRAYDSDTACPSGFIVPNPGTHFPLLSHAA